MNSDTYNSVFTRNLRHARAVIAIITLTATVCPPRVDGAVVTYEVIGSTFSVIPLPSRLVFSYDTDQVGNICINTDGDFGPGASITGSAYYGGAWLADFHSINLYVFTGAIRSGVDCVVPASPAELSLNLNGVTAFRPDGRLLGAGEVYTTPANIGDIWALSGIFTNTPEVPTGVYGWGQLTMREIPEPGAGAFTIGACVWLLSCRTRRLWSKAIQ
jgi:hypothetical protein